MNNKQPSPPLSALRFDGMEHQLAFRAVALGATAVLLGRLYTWGLAVAGEQGVRDVVLNFLADLDLTLALSGYTCFNELTPAALIRQAP